MADPVVSEGTSSVPAFVHLSTRSQYSLLDGAMEPAELVSGAKKAGFSAVALTDTCNFYGAYEFWKAAKEAGLKAILGSTIWVHPGDLGRRHRDDPDDGFHVTLLIEGGAEAASQKSPGYKNLCALITKAIFDGIHYRPRIDLNLLRKHREGLICLTGGLNGPLGIGASDRADGTERARAYLSTLAEIFDKDHLFIELQDFGVPRQQRHCELARNFAKEFDRLTVVTNDCRYVGPTDAVTLDVLNAVARGQCLDDVDRNGIPTDQQYIKSALEMAQLFPDDLESIARTSAIAARCVFKFVLAPPYFFPATDPPDADPPRPPDVRAKNAVRADTQANWEYFYTAYPPPDDFALERDGAGGVIRPKGAGSMNGYFEWFCREGLRRRIAQLSIPESRHAEYWDRLEFEIGIIEDMGFPAYLLIVAEFINWAKANGIPVGPGRGSGAGAVVNWAMRITDIDPLRFGLLMERFLNPERVSMPDIDVDFCQDRREEVIAHTREKYGSDLVSQIITYGKLQAKAAIKDVARVIGMDFKQADRIAKLVPAELGIKLDKAFEEDRLKIQLEKVPAIARVGALARRVEGMCRQTGVHAAGVVIADRPLVEHAPLYRDGPEGGPVVQYDMKASESVGLIKFDFLGLKTLDQIRDALAMIKRNTGEVIDLATLPFEDEATWQLLQKGDALGIFQVESSGMRDLLTRLKPSNIEDLIALLALYRPGPLESGMVENFIDCKHGRKAVEYPHISLKPILEATYGSIVYQEQVMQIAQVYAGYTLGGADLLRRAMGKKKPEEMAKQKAIFVEGSIRVGHREEDAGALFDLLAFFAGYGFNKSHSAAYGVISYHTAWLKAHHRAEYMAALMSIDAGNSEKVLLYTGDCRRAGIEVLPPDTNRSQRNFDVPKENRRQIRFGMAAVKGVGEGAVDAIIEAREAGGGSFRSFADFLERIDHRRVNRKVLEGLICCGALDWTGETRRAMLEGLLPAVQSAQRTQDERRSGQTSLFGGFGKAAAPALKLPSVGEWPLALRLSKEREALGFFITGHPMSAWRSSIVRLTSGTIDRLAQMEPDREVRIAGMVTALREITNKKGDKMAFVTVEDEHGSVECVFFKEPWALSRATLSSELPVLVVGRLEHGADGTAKVRGESARSLSEVREQQTREVHIVTDDQELREERIEEMMRLVRDSKGRCPVHLHLKRSDKAWVSFQLSKDIRVAADDHLVQSLEGLFGRSDAVRLT